MSETHENAFKLEAAEKRRQAANLLAEAERLDPKPQVEEKAPKDEPTTEEVEELAEAKSPKSKK